MEIAADLTRFRLPFQRLMVAACGLALLSSCSEEAPVPKHAYAALPNRDVPAYLKDTILEYTDLSGNEPFPISGYGLVTHLHGTGGSRVATPIRTFMIKQMAQHDFGSVANDLPSPERLLNSPDVAIVRVDGLIPPGARSALDHPTDPNVIGWERDHYPRGAGAAFDGKPAMTRDDWCTWFDVRVSILPGSDATSLAHGVLYQTDLKVNGANPSDPGTQGVFPKAQAAGEVFINPAYVLNSADDSPAARDSRKTGTILFGARALEDRPLLLRLRSPGRRLARAIEQRIIERFQDVVDDDLHPGTGSDAASSKKVADAHDEGVVYFYVPRAYAENWEHFAGVVRHLYLSGGSPEFAATKSHELADEAVKPNAKLLDISYCWEGLGKPALYAIGPLLSSDQPEVQFAAARAAAFLDDPAAVPVLLSIAQTKGNPFRVNAVEVLAELPPTPRVDRLCRVLLNSDESNVRVEAYKLLAKHRDTSVYSRWITDGDREVFALDLVPSSAPPMIWASQQGVPRVAVFGNQTELDLPLLFSTLDQRLTISSDAEGSPVTIFYRGPGLRKPVSAQSTSSLPELVAQLAGDRGTGFSGLHFSYGDVVGILQTLVDQHRVSGLCGQQRLLASFVLQEPTKTFEALDEGSSRPLLRRDGPRPQSENPAAEDKPLANPLLRPEPVDPLAPAVSGSNEK